MTFSHGITLTTGRLVLRPHDESDVPEVVAAGQDPEMRRWMWWAPTQDRAQALEFCTKLAHQEPESKLLFAVTVRDRCAGSVGLQRAEWVSGRVEIGYWLSAWARGKGYATEAVRALTAHAFRAGLHRVELLAATGNVASQQVAERCGFVREGVLREAGLLPGGGRSDMVVYGLLREDGR